MLGFAFSNFTYNPKLFFILNSGFRLLHGASQALVQVTTYSITGFVFSDHLPFYIGVHEFACGLGLAFGPLLAQYLILNGSYQMPFYIIAGILALCGVLTHFALDEQIENEPDETDSREIPQI